jgi:shikimate 5-dehydrogenase
MPIPESALDGGLVYDLVYNPPRTALLKSAERRGCRTIGGLDMLVAQAQAQFAWWTGVTPSARLMRNAAMTRLDEMNRS